MVNAAVSALCGTERSTSVLLFPTRLLNEDMFRRLTTFIFHLRTHLPELGITGGLLLGTDDPLYRLTLEPQSGEVIHQFGNCPQCNHYEIIAQSFPGTTRLVPSCTRCGHVVNYMYNPRETPSFLPDLIIATPDKLFAEATTNSYIWGQYGLFGAAVRRCNVCGRARIASWFTLKPSERCQDVFKQEKCPGHFTATIKSKPIRYMGFDEVHSLHGQTVTYLSVFLATLEIIQRILTNSRSFAIRFETATATIANERELLEAITRRRHDNKEIISIPEDNQIGKYFSVSPDRVRHRVLLTMPTHVTSRNAMIKALLNAYNNLHGSSKLLLRRLQNVTTTPSAWNFIMGYVLKIDDGLDFRRAIIDYYQNARNKTLAVEFLSGFSPKTQISRLIDSARKGAVDILLANLVVSLGIDIHDLNHMIMFGVPRGFTEYVQTAGRTGRGEVSGHVNIILVPHLPRDAYLYRHFHAVFSDVVGYYDVLPVRSTNLFCSEEIFGNVANAIISTLCIIEGKWTHRSGINDIITRRKQQIPNAISVVLCDDANLKTETDRLVARKIGALQREITQLDGFLGPMLNERGWLIRSLRGRSTRTVQILHSDQELLELIERQGDMPVDMSTASEETT